MSHSSSCELVSSPTCAPLASAGRTDIQLLKAVHTLHHASVISWEMACTELLHAWGTWMPSSAPAVQSSALSVGPCMCCRCKCELLQPSSLRCIETESSQKNNLGSFFLTKLPRPPPSGA
jgi:hypothetical protein